MVSGGGEQKKSENYLLVCRALKHSLSEEAHVGNVNRVVVATFSYPLFRNLLPTREATRDSFSAFFFLFLLLLRLLLSNDKNAIKCLKKRYELTFFRSTPHYFCLQHTDSDNDRW